MDDNLRKGSQKAENEVKEIGRQKGDGVEIARF